MSMSIFNVHVQCHLYFIFTLVHRNTVGFFFFSLVNPRLIHCAAILLDLDMITLTRNSKFKADKMFIIITRFFEDFAQTDTIFLEAVEQAQFVFCYHARVPYLCGVMAHLLLSAILGAWSVELLTKLGSVCCWDGREDCCRIMDIFKGI